MKMSWFFTIFFLSFTISNLEAVPDQKKLPSTVVVGAVYCDTCFQEDFSKSSHFISGASVAVECRHGAIKQSFRQEVKTDEHGEFRIPLPFSVSKHVKKIKRCSVKLIRSSEPNCAVASAATSSSLHLKSRKEGTHIFSAGFFTFKPLNQPNLCNQKPSLHNPKEFNFKEVPVDDGNTIFPPPIQDPSTPPDLPSIPLLPKLPPLPQLPPLPPLPGLPNLPPIPGKTTTQTKPEELSSVVQLSGQKVSHPHFFFPTTPLPPNPFLPPQIFPPNPLQPPPLFPPNPLQPPPLFPPNPLLPPPSPLIPLPPIPGLTPPPPPSFTFPPLPPFPFPPSPPRIPGVPRGRAPPSPRKPSP